MRYGLVPYSLFVGLTPHHPNIAIEFPVCRCHDASLPKPASDIEFDEQCGVCKDLSPSIMNSRERIQALVSGEILDRIGLADAPWPETRVRWRKEGIPEGVHANDHFRTDIRHQIRLDASFRLAESVEEDAAEYQLVRDSEGGLTKRWKYSGVPHTFEFGMKDRTDWERLRDRLVPDITRASWGYYGDYAHEYVSGTFETVKAAYDACSTRQTTFVPVSIADPYECFLSKMGDERMLILMTTEPQLVGDMFDAHVSFTNSMLDLLVEKGFQVDALWLGGDIAYRNGLLFSPAMYRELLLPRHKAMIEHAKKVHGLPVIYHTDGNCIEAIPLLIEAGIDCLQPLEVRAGLDVRKLAPEFGNRLAWMGNISVESLTIGGKPMRDEIISKIKVMTHGRHRYVFHSDHSVPPEVSLANFSEAVRIVEEYGTYG